MKREISSGGVVFKKSSRTFKVLLLKDKNNFWSFPKGLIEENEDKLTAAKREIGEETGIKKLKLICELSAIGYYYKWGGEIVKKTVYFFLFETTEGEIPKPQLEEGITEVKWFSLDGAIKNIGYVKTNRAVLEEVKRHCGERSHEVI